MTRVHEPGFRAFMPSEQQLAGTRALDGYQVDHADMDAVMHETGIGDARVLAWTSKEHDDGDRILTQDEMRAGAAYAKSPSLRQLAQNRSSDLDGFRWRTSVVDSVMQQFGVADVNALLSLAARIEDGNRYLNRSELEAAARKLSKNGYRWTPGVMAQVMNDYGIASESAILREARRHDSDHNRYLNRGELEAAAAVVAGITNPNDPHAIINRVEELGKNPLVELETIGEVGPYPVHAMKIPSVGVPKMRVCITAGVHGNEPCGPGAALLLVEQLLEHPELREGLEITVIPLVNPIGIENATRRNDDNIDLNREFDPNDPTAPHEVQIIDDYLASHPVDLGLDLHSGGASRNGFWALHLDSEPLFTDAINRLDGSLPLLHDFTDPYTLSEPGLGSSGNGSTLKGLFVDHGARWAATLEAPGSVSYLDQVLGQNEMVNQILAAARDRANCVA